MTQYLYGSNADRTTEIAKIPLTHGYVAIVDAADYARLSCDKWHASVRKGLVYAVAKSGRNKIYMHRVIMGAKRGECVDHINNNGIDNRRSNLRFATHSQNMANARFEKGTSGYRGVAWSRDQGKWKAKIKNHGRHINLGTFTDAADAARAYDAKALEIYGDFARLNFPSEEPLVPIPICPIHDAPTTPRLSPARTLVQHCQSCADELGVETFIVGTTTAQDRAARREREAAA